MEQKEDLKTDIALAMQNADLSVAPVNASSASGTITSIDKASEIVRNMMDEAENVLQNIGLVLH